MHHSTRRIAGLALASALAVAACSAAATPTPAPPSAQPSAVASSGGAPGSVTVGTATSGTLGVYLTGTGGMTLYILTKDSQGQSTCSGSCAQNWPPLTVAAGGSATAGAGVSGTFATLTRADGTTQVTHDGMPLYYFAGDTKAGDTNGQGTGGVWFVATPTGGGPAGGSSASPGAPSASPSDYNY